MPEYSVQVKLTARVRVQAANGIVARRVAISALLSLTADDIRIPDNDAAFRGNGPLTEATFSVEGRPEIVAIGARAKSVKRSPTKGR